MTPRRAPSLDKRRAPEFAAELLARARAWIPSWGLADDERDFGRALLEIAARFSAEVAERLDGAGEKMQRGFLDWLAVRGEAARPARVPVAFKLADAATAAVLASHPVRMQADAGGASVILETETDVRVLPGRLDAVVATDAAGDAFYLPPAGLSDLKPVEPAPTEWELKSFAAAGAATLQLDPEAGLAAGLLIEAAGQQYQLVTVDKEIVTIHPRLAVDLPASTVVRKVSAFAPFDGPARNRQEHALYLGDTDLLDVEAAATIDVVGARALSTGIAWQYWGKVEGNDVDDWQPLTLATQQKSDALVLTKGKGAVVPKEIGGRSSRWIRGVTTNVSQSAPLAQVDAFQLRINCTGAPAPGPSPTADAFANTTPLVLDGAFFPLGKTPRQFDAFYLGSKEAFSKKGAAVDLDFQLADPTFAALSVVRGGVFSNRVLAGVGQDRALHLLTFDPTTGAVSKFRNREPLQPSSGAANPISLDQMPRWRPPVFVLGNDFFVAVTAGDAVWVWLEDFIDPSHSRWNDFGRLPPTSQGSASQVDGLVFLGPGRLAALRGGALFVRDATSGGWNPVPMSDGIDPATMLPRTVTLTSIVPVQAQTPAGELVPSPTGDMVGIGSSTATAPGNGAFRVKVDGSCTQLLPGNNFEAGLAPIAVDSTPVFAAAVTASNPPELVVASVATPATLDAGQSVAGLDVALSGGTIHLVATVRDPSGDRILTWAPFATGLLAEKLESPVAASGTNLGGAPTVVGKRVVVPGARADVLANEFDPARRLVTSAIMQIGVRVPDFIPSLAVGDLIGRGTTPPSLVTGKITATGTPKGGENLYPLDAFPAAATGDLIAFRAASTFRGKIVGGKLTLDPLDVDTKQGDWVFIPDLNGAAFGIGASVGGAAATLTPVLAATPIPTNSNNASYVPGRLTGGRLAPFMALDPLTNGNWDVTLLDRSELLFPGPPVVRLKGKAFDSTSGKPTLVALLEEFKTGLVTFLVDGAFGDWRRYVDEIASNPDLSWEYWNGTGWWRVAVTLDETLNLKSSGHIKFEVPADIASSDWAGKTNFWIRARLVGGDYGQETVTVVTTNLPNNAGSVQTVVRSNDGVRPPVVVELHISYSVCEDVLPTFLLTQDSGSLRDQSDANRTAGAIVEAFVPLAVMLGRLAGGAPADTGSAGHDCPPECGCGGAEAAAAGTSPAPATTTSTSAPAPAPAPGRALFIGLTVPPSDAPVNVLLLVAEERTHAAFAPLTIAALTSDGFVPVVADDVSRALGESGILSMIFTVRPPVRELFGRQCAWLRLTPDTRAAADKWKPTLRGAYLNAVWASAMETLTRELVGSSDGAPNITLNLARPPLLRDTLELRVKEPLGEEELTQLQTEDATAVLDDVQGLEGYWVLWKRVVDPGDENAAARVYALDEATGAIRFGDGLHGKIPPIGRDSIVAFSYKRTEPGAPGSDVVPGNEIAPRTTLNLVTPVETVESVIAADQAAGGAPPESDDRVVRFGSARLRHRARAVTLEDLEDLTLESSPDFVQARCLRGRGHVRLIVVKRGDDPRLNAAQVRELGRLLQAAGPVSLGATGALRIEAPFVRRLRIELTLRIDRLDNAGELGRWVKDRLAALLDTATGGADGVGWRLGDSPKEEDVGLALIEAPHLESIAGVALFESAGDSAHRPWPAALAPTELAMLAADPIRIQFFPIEETA